jgi:hypothetical protein
LRFCKLFGVSLTKFLKILCSQSNKVVFGRVIVGGVYNELTFDAEFTIEFGDKSVGIILLLNKKNKKK